MLQKTLTIATSCVSATTFHLLLRVSIRKKTKTKNEAYKAEDFLRETMPLVTEPCIDHGQDKAVECGGGLSET